MPVPSACFSAWPVAQEVSGSVWDPPSAADRESGA